MIYKNRLVDKDILINRQIGRHRRQAHTNIDKINNGMDGRIT